MISKLSGFVPIEYESPLFFLIVRVSQSLIILVIPLTISWLRKRVNSGTFSDELVFCSSQGNPLTLKRFMWKIVAPLPETTVKACMGFFFICQTLFHVLNIFFQWFVQLRLPFYRWGSWGTWPVSYSSEWLNNLTSKLTVLVSMSE